MTFVIEALARRHDRSRFSCGSEALDHYIRRQASQDVRRKMSRVFVALPGEMEEVAGFYTLSAGSIERATLPAGEMRQLPHYPVPVALIGRLGVDRHWAGQGLGAALLTDAFHRVRHASRTLAVYAVVVDAKDERAKAFYEHFGFTPFPRSGRRLFFPMAAVERLLHE